MLVAPSSSPAFVERPPESNLASGAPGQYKHCTVGSAGDGIEFDENASRATEAIYTTQDVVDQRQAIIQALALRAGERVLDIGAGPGFLAAEIAQAVGPTGAVAGVDVSESMLELARRRDLPDGSAPVELRTADALDLPFADASFDVAVATQVYEYVADMPAALAEARRVLVAYDADVAGVKGAAALAGLAGRVRITRPLGAKDLTEMHRAR